MLVQPEIWIWTEWNFQILLPHHLRALCSLKKSAAAWAMAAHRECYSRKMLANQEDTLWVLSMEGRRKWLHTHIYTIYTHLSHNPGVIVVSMKFGAVGEGLEAAQQFDEWLKIGFNFVFSIFLRELPLHHPQQLMSVLTDIVCLRNLPSGAHLSTRDTTTLQQCNTLVMTNLSPLSFRTSGIDSARNSLWNCKWEVKLSGKLSGKSDKMGRERKNNKKIIMSLRNRKQAVLPNTAFAVKNRVRARWLLQTLQLLSGCPKSLHSLWRLPMLCVIFHCSSYKLSVPQQCCLHYFYVFPLHFPIMRTTEKQCVGAGCSDGSAAAQCSHMSGGTSWHWDHHPVLEMSAAESVLSEGWLMQCSGRGENKKQMMREMV